MCKNNILIISIWQLPSYEKLKVPKCHSLHTQYSTHDSGACLYPPVLSNIKAERKKKIFIMKTHP